jgi:hypothetical protein
VTVVGSLRVERRHLGPLPTQVRDQIRRTLVARHVVALADRVLRLAPLARREKLRVIVQAEEIEACAVAREVAGVRRRMRPLALDDGKAEREGIEGEGGVDVEITEQDLSAPFVVDGAHRPELRVVTRLEDWPRNPRPRGHPRTREIPSNARGEGEEQGGQPHQDDQAGQQDLADDRSHAVRLVETVCDAR